MTPSTLEKHAIALSFIGKENVIELCKLFGNERLSFVTLRSILHEEKIKQELQLKRGISTTAKSCGVHRSTIYRKLKKGGLI